MEDNLLPNFTDLNVNVIKKKKPSKLAYKINHHRDLT